MKNTDNDNVKKDVLRPSDLANRLGMSPNEARALMKSESFPSFRIGKRLMVASDAYDEWLSHMKRKQITLD